MLATEVGHVCLVEEVELRESGLTLVIEHHRHEQVHRHTEDLDIGEEEESGKGINQ